MEGGVQIYPDHCLHLGLHLTLPIDLNQGLDLPMNLPMSLDLPTTLALMNLLLVAQKTVMMILRNKTHFLILRKLVKQDSSSDLSPVFFVVQYGGYETFFRYLL